MITYFDNGYGHTEGCGCCSNEIEGKEKILDEAGDNIDMVKEICKYYNIPFDEFIKQLEL